MVQDTSMRLDALEITVSYQSNMIDEMSAVIAQQWQSIERMQQKLDGLASRFADIEDQAGSPAENTKPPHW